MNAMAARTPNPIPRNSGAGRHPFTSVLKTYPNGSNQIMSDRRIGLLPALSDRRITFRQSASGRRTTFGHSDSCRRVKFYPNPSRRLTSPDRSRLCLLEETSQVVLCQLEETGRPGSLRSPVPETGRTRLPRVTSRRRTEFGSSRSVSRRQVSSTQVLSDRRIMLESSRVMSGRHAVLCPVESRRRVLLRCACSHRRTSLFRVVFESGRQAYSCRDRSSPVNETYRVGSAHVTSDRRIAPLCLTFLPRDKSSQVLSGRILETYRADLHLIMSHRPPISACVGSCPVDKPGLSPSCPGDCSPSIKSVLVGETNLPRSSLVLETCPVTPYCLTETNRLKLRRIRETVQVRLDRPCSSPRDVSCWVPSLRVAETYRVE